MKVNGYVSGINQSFSIFLPFVGAGLFAVIGGAGTAGLTAAAFIIASVLYWRIRLPQGLPEMQQKEKIRASAKRGWGYIRENPPLFRHVIVGMCVMGIAGAIEAGALGFIKDDLGISPNWVGVVLGIQGVGTVLGILLAQILLKKYSLFALESAGIIVTGAGVFLCIPGILLLAAPAPIITGVGFGIFVISYSVGVQSASPERHYSLVNGTSSSMVMLAQIVTVTGGIIVLPIAGARVLIAFVGIGLLIVGVASALVHRMKPIAISE